MGMHTIPQKTGSRVAQFLGFYPQCCTTLYLRFRYPATDMTSSFDPVTIGPLTLDTALSPAIGVGAGGEGADFFQAAIHSPVAAQDFSVQ